MASHACRRLWLLTKSDNPSPELLTPILGARTPAVAEVLYQNGV